MPPSTCRSATWRTAHSRTRRSTSSTRPASRVRLRSSSAPPNIKEAQHELEEVTRQKDEAIAAQDYEAAARAARRGGKAKEHIEELRNAWHEEIAKETPVVTDEDIAQVVSMWTGIPVVRISQEEKERLLHMEEALHKRVIGQQEAIETVSKAVRRARAGLKDPKRPIGSFIFMGPTGVGKTELAGRWPSSCSAARTP